MARSTTSSSRSDPNVTINFEPLGQGATWTKAQTSRIAGQTADVTATYGFAPQDIINFQPDNQFIDLSGLDVAQELRPDQRRALHDLEGQGLADDPVLRRPHRVDQRGHAGQVQPQAAHDVRRVEHDVRDAQVEQGDADLLRCQAVDGAQPLRQPGRDDGRAAEAPELLVRLAGHRARPTSPPPSGSSRSSGPRTSSTKYFDPAFSGIDYPTSGRPVRHRQVRDVARGLVLRRRHHGRQADLPEARRVQRRVLATTPTANAVQPVYGDIGWAGLRYSKNSDIVMEWIDFFGQKENFQSFMQVLAVLPDPGHAS